MLANSFAGIDTGVSEVTGSLYLLHSCLEAHNAAAGVPTDGELHQHPQDDGSWERPQTALPGLVPRL